MECLPVGTGAWPDNPPPSVRNNFEDPVVCLPPCGRSTQNRYYGSRGSGSPSSQLDLYCCRTACTGVDSTDFGVVNIGGGSTCVLNNDLSANRNGPNCSPGSDKPGSFIDGWCSARDTTSPSAKPFELLCPQEPGLARSFCNGNVAVPIDLGNWTAFYNHQMRKWHTTVFEPNEGFGCDVSVLERIYSDGIVTVHHTVDRSETRFSGGRSEFFEQGDFRTLSGGGGNWVMTDSVGTQTTFNHKVGNFSYPTEVRYADGRTITFSYFQPNSPVLDSISFPDNRRINFRSELVGQKVPLRVYTVWTDEYQRQNKFTRSPLTWEDPLRVQYDFGLGIEYRGGERVELNFNGDNTLSLASDSLHAGNRQAETVVRWIFGKYAHDSVVRNTSLSDLAQGGAKYGMRYSRDSLGRGKIDLVSRDENDRVLKTYVIDYYKPQDPRSAYVAEEFRKGQQQFSRKLDAEGKVLWQRDALNSLTEYFYGTSANCSTADLSSDSPLPTCIKSQADSQTVKIERDAGNHFRPTVVTLLGANEKEILTHRLSWNGARILNVSTSLAKKEYSAVTYQYTANKYYPAQIDRSSTVETTFDRQTGLTRSLASSAGEFKFKYNEMGVPTSMQVGGITIDVQRSISAANGAQLRFKHPSGVEAETSSNLYGDEVLATIRGPTNNQLGARSQVLFATHSTLGSTQNSTAIYSQDGGTADGEINYKVTDNGLVQTSNATVKDK